MHDVLCLIIGAVLGAWGCHSWLRYQPIPGPRQIVVGSGRYMRAIARERNANYGREYQDATEAARAAQRWN